MGMRRTTLDRRLGTTVGFQTSARVFAAALQPGDEFGAGHTPSGKPEHQVLLLVDRRFDLETVQQQERLHGGVGNPLVAIQERMIHHQRERERPRRRRLPVGALAVKSSSYFVSIQARPPPAIAPTGAPIMAPFRPGSSHWQPVASALQYAKRRWIGSGPVGASLTPRAGMEPPGFSPREPG